MNSQQRRRYRRQWPATITLQYDLKQPFFSQEDRMTQAEQWCCDQGYRVSVNYTWSNAGFKFTQEQHAVHFALVWV